MEKLHECVIAHRVVYTQLIKQLVRRTNTRVITVLPHLLDYKMHQIATNV